MQTPRRGWGWPPLQDRSQPPRGDARGAPPGLGLWCGVEGPEGFRGAVRSRARLLAPGPGLSLPKGEPRPGGVGSPGCLRGGDPEQSSRARVNLSPGPAAWRGLRTLDPASPSAGRGAGPNPTGKGRGGDWGQVGIPVCGGLGWGWRGARSGETPLERCEPGSEGRQSSLEPGGRTAPGERSLRPKCVTGMLWADSAGSSWPRKPKDPNSIALRIVGQVHALPGTLSNDTTVFLRLRGLICDLLFSAPRGEMERRRSLFR